MAMSRNKMMARMHAVDKKLLSADAAYEKANEAAMAALKKAMFPGRLVNWKHGNHWRGGEVVELCWSSDYGGMDVLVKSSASGKTYRVAASWLMREI